MGFWSNKISNSPSRSLTKEDLEALSESIIKNEKRREEIERQRVQGYFAAPPEFRKRWDELQLQGRIRIDSSGYALMDHKAYEELYKLAEIKED